MRRARLTIAAVSAVVVALVLAPAALAAPAVPALSGTEGTAFPSTTTVATFSDGFFVLLFGCTAQSSYTATVNWGDGTTDTGTVKFVSGSSLGDPCDYEVEDGHTYAEFGTYTVTVNVTGGGGPGQGTGTATIADAALTAGSAVTASATENAQFSGTVATFSDTNTSGSSADFTTTIHWGDGTTSPGTLTQTSAGHYSVSGTHTWAEEGSYSTSVTVNDQGGSTVTIGGTATVADAPLTAGTPIAINVTENVGFSGTVATFSDANSSATIADFVATIHWGDGSTSTGTVTMTSAGHFSVTGSHTWVRAGTYPNAVDVTDQGGSTVVITGSASVADAALTAGSATTITASAGTAFNGDLGTFTDDNTAAQATDFTGTIDWGDGSTSFATITSTSTPGQFTVSGQHTYSAGGTFPLSIAIHDTGGSSTTLTGTANVSIPPLAAGTAVPISGTEGTAFSGTVANFSDSNPSGSAGDFTATIDWGDGTTSHGSVAQTSAGHYAVSATHTWTEEGSYPTAVAISDSDGASLTIDGTAPVADAPLTAGTAATITGAPGTALSGTVGTFTDGNAGASASDFTGTITWGDGSSSDATITAGSTAGQFTVSGTHTYAADGTYPISIAISDTGGSTVTVTGTASVSTPPPPALTTLKVYAATATAGQPIDALLGAFSDADSGTTASSYSATITWGDGTTSGGSIVASGNPSVFGIVGVHTYAATGTYTITIAVHAPLGRTLTMTTTAAITPPKPPPPPKPLAIAIRHTAIVKGRGLAVTVSCPRSASTCRGYLAATRGRRKLGALMFILPGGKSGTFDLRVPAQLRRHHTKLKITATAIDPRSSLAGSATKTIAA